MILGRKLAVSLDGRDITSYVRDVEIEGPCDEHPIVWDFYVEGTHVEADLWPAGLRELVERGAVGDSIEDENGRVEIVGRTVEDGVLSVTLARIPR